MTPDLFRVLRDRQGAAAGAAGRLLLPEAVAENPAFVGRVFANPTVPTTTGNYFAVHPVFVSGTEAEAGPGALTVNQAVTVPVFVIGSQAPADDDDLVCRFVGNRWVAERLGKSKNQVILTGCPCASTPATLHMSVNNPALNFGVFQPATFVYQSVPPVYQPLSIGAKAYLSTETFTETYNPDAFTYWFTCYSGYYALSRLYAKSALGSPYRDNFKYIWLVGRPGNTCTPFLLSSGQVYPGGDPAVVVTISE